MNDLESMQKINLNTWKLECCQTVGEKKAQLQDFIQKTFDTKVFLVFVHPYEYHKLEYTNVVDDQTMHPKS